MIIWRNMARIIWRGSEVRVNKFAAFDSPLFEKEGRGIYKVLV